MKSSNFFVFSDSVLKSFDRKIQFDSKALSPIVDIVRNVSIILNQTNVLEQSQHIEWKILNFTSFSDTDGFYCHSPEFSFAGGCRNLKVYPNGLKEANSIGYIGLYLVQLF